MWVSSNNAGITNPSASASRAGWYGEGGHDCCEAYQKDEASKVSAHVSESTVSYDRARETIYTHLLGPRWPSAARGPKRIAQRRRRSASIARGSSLSCGTSSPSAQRMTFPFGLCALLHPSSREPNSALLMRQPPLPAPQRPPPPLPRSSAGPVRSSRGRARRDGSHRALPRRGARAL